MKTSRFNESQIIKAIKEHEGGRKAEDIVRDLGISQGTFYKWKQKYGGMEASDVKRIFLFFSFFASSIPPKPPPIITTRGILFGTKEDVFIWVLIAVL
jgi:hypothetical protein